MNESQNPLKIVYLPVVEKEAKGTGLEVFILSDSLEISKDPLLKLSAKEISGLSKNVPFKGKEDSRFSCGFVYATIQMKAVYTALKKHFEKTFGEGQYSVEVYTPGKNYRATLKFLCN